MASPEHAHVNVTAHLLPGTDVTVEELDDHDPAGTQILVIGGPSGRLAVFMPTDQLRRLRGLLDQRLTELDGAAGSVGN